MGTTASGKRATGRSLDKVVRYDPELLQAVRAALIEKLHRRLEPTWGEMELPGGDTPVSLILVNGFTDPEFVAAFGPGLSHVADSTLVNEALAQLLRQVAEAPERKTGLPLFDDWSP